MDTFVHVSYLFYALSAPIRAVISAPYGLNFGAAIHKRISYFPALGEAGSWEETAQGVFKYLYVGVFPRVADAVVSVDEWYGE
jgi:hypothetical protein